MGVWGGIFGGWVVFCVVSGGVECVEGGFLGGWEYFLLGMWGVVGRMCWGFWVGGWGFGGVFRFKIFG